MTISPGPRIASRVRSRAAQLVRGAMIAVQDGAERALDVAEMGVVEDRRIARRGGELADGGHRRPPLRSASGGRRRRARRPSAIFRRCRTCRRGCRISAHTSSGADAACAPQHDQLIDEIGALADDGARCGAAPLRARLRRPLPSLFAPSLRRPAASRRAVRGLSARSPDRARRRAARFRPHRRASAIRANGCDRAVSCLTRAAMSLPSIPRW